MLGREAALARSLPTSRLDADTRREENLKVARTCVSIAMENILASSHSGRDFSKIGAHRGLFSPLQRDGRIVASPLSTRLFGIDPHKNYGALHQFIDNKRIMLPGGGTSLQDMTVQDEHDPDALLPDTLLNVDPYTPDADRRRARYYAHLKLDPTSENFLNDLRAAGYGKFDEIWASSSVPHYCTTAGEIETFFTNMYEALDANGTLRIYPLAFLVENLESLDYLGAEKREERLAPLRLGLSAALTTLANKDDIVLSVQYSSPRDLSIKDPATLLIHKRETTAKS